MLDWPYKPAQELPWLSAQTAKLLARVRDGALGHATLLAGPAGVGKRAIAAQIVASLLCTNRQADGAACAGRVAQPCASCTQRLAGGHVDLVIAEPEEDKRELSVDTIREFARKMFLTGQHGGRVGVIDPADTMNRSAANALLKTLEEPPSGSHIILIADRPALLMPTILSRCQLERVGVADRAAAHAWLAEHHPELPESARPWFASRPLAAAQAQGDAAAHSQRSAEHAELWPDWEQALTRLWAGHADAVSVAAQIGEKQADAWTRWFYRMLVAALRGRAGWLGNTPPHLDSLRELVDSNASALRLINSNSSRALMLEMQLIACTKAATLAQRASRAQPA